MSSVYQFSEPVMFTQLIVAIAHSDKLAIFHNPKEKYNPFAFWIHMDIDGKSHSVRCFNWDTEVTIERYGTNKGELIMQELASLMQLGFDEDYMIDREWYSAIWSKVLDNCLETI